MVFSANGFSLTRIAQNSDFVVFFPFRPPAQSGLRPGGTKRKKAIRLRRRGSGCLAQRAWRLEQRVLWVDLEQGGFCGDQGWRCGRSRGICPVL